MQNIIQELIAIEAEAERIVDEAAGSGRGYDDKREEAVRRLTEEIEEETKKEIKKLREISDSEIYGEIERIRRLSQHWFAQMERVYGDNYEQWKAAIISGVTGGGADGL